MKKAILIAGAMLALAATVASAAGINLAWDNCASAGAGGTPPAVQNKTFACNSNTGAGFALVASFIPPPNVNEFLGVSSQIDVVFDAATVPDWWAHGTGFCRGTTNMSTSFDFTGGPFDCADFSAGQAAGGFAYDVGFGTPNRARLRVQYAVPFDNRGPVDENTEYYSYKVNILRGKTTGTGACAGCSTAACIVLNDLQLFQPPEAGNDPDITNPALTNFATWQANPTGQAAPCPASTPTHNSSWGQLKSLYR
jgi:hypothetical protein